MTNVSSYSVIHFPGQNLFSKPQITKQFYSIYLADSDAILESGAQPRTYRTTLVLPVYTMPYPRKAISISCTNSAQLITYLFNRERWTAKSVKVPKLHFIISMEQPQFVIAVVDFSWGQFKVGFTKSFAKDTLPSVKSIRIIVKVAKSVDLKNV